MRCGACASNPSTSLRTARSGSKPSISEPAEPARVAHEDWTREPGMNEREVRSRAFAMPLTSPAFPPGPYRFVNREFFTIVYRTRLDALRAVVPEPLEPSQPVVKFEFIRMADSTGFGDYTEAGQVIPVRFQG